MKALGEKSGEKWKTQSTVLWPHKLGKTSTIITSNYLLNTFIHIFINTYIHKYMYTCMYVHMFVVQKESHDPSSWINYVFWTLISIDSFISCGIEKDWLMQWRSFFSKETKIPSMRMTRGSLMTETFFFKSTKLYVIDEGVGQEWTETCQTLNLTKRARGEMEIHHKKSHITNICCGIPAEPPRNMSRLPLLNPLCLSSQQQTTTSPSSTHL